MPAATANQTPPFLQLVGRVLWNGIATADAFTLAVLAGLLTLAVCRPVVSFDRTLGFLLLEHLPQDTGDA